MISFACPACNRELSVKDEFSGKRGTCPHCKKTLLVPIPAPAAVPARPVAPDPQAAANPPPLAEAMTAALPDDTPSSPVVGGAPKLDFLAPAQKPDELGRLGTYRVLKVLGAGGMGMVLLADDPVLKRPVALKVMRPKLAKDKTARPGTPGRGVGGEGFALRQTKRIGSLLWSLRPWAFRRPGLAFAVEGVVLAFLLLLILLPFLSRQQEVPNQQPDQPKGPEPFIINSLNMKLVYIPPGKFTMGSSPAEIESAL